MKIDRMTDDRRIATLLAVTRKLESTALDDVLDVFDARGIAVSDEHRERILGCTDIETLKRWLRSSVTVASADDLFVD